MDEKKKLRNSHSDYIALFKFIYLLLYLSFDIFFHVKETLLKKNEKW